MKKETLGIVKGGKYLESSSDGRVIVKKYEVKSPEKERLPDNFYVVCAYGDMCLAYDIDESGKNMELVAWYVGPNDPMRKKYDPVLVGMFVPALKDKRI